MPNEMEIRLEDILHPRLQAECLDLFNRGHFKHAAFEAMQQVEAALREKGVAAPQAFGVRLVQQTFGRAGHITLTVPLGEDLQADATTLFEGAFRYYRNYAAHAGTKIDRTIALRVMILASELLDMLAASRRSFVKMGGLDGLLAHRSFQSAEDVAACLRFLGRTWFPEDATDGYFEDMAESGVSEEQVELCFDLGLVVSRSQPIEEAFGGSITSFELTDMGKALLADAEGRSNAG